VPFPAFGLTARKGLLMVRSMHKNVNETVKRSCVDGERHPNPKGRRKPVAGAALLDVQLEIEPPRYPGL
jgi:hypothetical protein